MSFIVRLASVFILSVVCVGSLRAESMSFPRRKFLDYRLVYSAISEFHPNEIPYQPSPENLRELESIPGNDSENHNCDYVWREFGKFYMVATFPGSDIYLMISDSPSHRASDPFRVILAANDKKKELYILNCAHSGSVYDASYRISETGDWLLTFSTEADLFTEKLLPYRVAESSLSLDRESLGLISKAFQPFKSPESETDEESENQYHLYLIEDPELIETCEWKGLKINMLKDNRLEKLMIPLPLK